jgi:hypothetical protein
MFFIILVQEPELIVEPEKKEEPKMIIERNMDKASNPSRPQVLELNSDFNF